MIRALIKSPKVTALMFTVLLVPWYFLEQLFAVDAAVFAIRLGFLIGLASYPVFHLIYRLSIGQNISMGLAGIGLSFLVKVVIVSGSGFVVWKLWRINLLYLMPPLFFSLLSLNFFAIYFAKE